MTDPRPSPEPRLVLASGSPRRRDLLDGLGLSFQVRPVDVDESPFSDEGPEDYVLRLAEEKATARSEPGEVVIAADTTVVLDGEILGKPDGSEEARRMVSRLAGRSHSVLTGVAVHQGGAARGTAGRTEVGVEISGVTFGPMSEEEIAWYASTREPLDKAGGYAIQGLGALFIDSLEGNYSNVVGLPLPLLYRLLRRLGHDLRSWR